MKFDLILRLTRAKSPLGRFSVSPGNLALVPNIRQTNTKQNPIIPPAIYR